MCSAKVRKVFYCASHQFLFYLKSRNFELIETISKELQVLFMVGSVNENLLKHDENAIMIKL